MSHPNSLNDILSDVAIDPVDFGSSQDDGQHQSGSNAGTSTEFSNSEVFDILRNSRRRLVLKYLLEENEKTTVKKLTKFVGTNEYDLDGKEMTSEQHKRVYTALYQCHLPRLAKANIIDFDQEENVVTLDEASSMFSPYLQNEAATEWVHIELAIAVIVAILVSLGVFGVGPFGRVSVMTWAMITTVSVFVIGVSQLIV